MKMAMLFALFVGLLLTLGGCASNRDYSAREDTGSSRPSGCCPGH